MKKDELITALEDSREEFLSAIEDLPEEQMLVSGAAGVWSIKDILAHLLMWEAETIKLLYQARQGLTPTTVHLNNVSDDDQNRIWHSQLKDRPLDRVLADFSAIREQTIRRLEEFSDKDLSDPSRYVWLRGKTLNQLIKEYILDHEQQHTRAILEWRRHQGTE